LPTQNKQERAGFQLSGLIAPQDSGPICVCYRGWMMNTRWSISLYTLLYPGDKEPYHAV